MTMLKLFTARRRWCSRIAATALVLALLSLVAGVAHAQPGHGKIDKAVRAALETPSDDGLIPVIVTLAPGARPGIRALLRAHGAEVTREFDLIQAVTADLPPNLIRVLAAVKDVIAISGDAEVTPSGITSLVVGAPLNTPYTLRKTLGLAASPPYKRTGVTVAVIDSGIYKSSDFGTRIVASRDFTQGGISVSPSDPCGHGTVVASVIGGASPNFASDQAWWGVATAVNFVNLRVLGADGSGSTSNVVSALQWAVTNRVAYKIDVINLSLGHPIYERAATDPLVQAVEAAVRAGIVVVVAAGNVGVSPVTGQPAYGGILSPANAPSAITVGAADDQQTTRCTDDLLAPFSSRGPTWYDAFAKPDLVAPGRRLMGALDPTAYLWSRTTGNVRYWTTDGYANFNGTSLAAPVVTGTVALVLEAGKKAFSGVKPTPATVKGMLMQTAFPMSNAAGVPYDVLTQGAGELNLQGATTLAKSIDPRKALGANWLVKSVTESTVVDGQTITWGQNIVWGDAIYTNKTSWANNIVWGDNIVWGNVSLSEAYTQSLSVLTMR
jgi:serine protease AprX